MDTSKFKTPQQCRDRIEWLERLKFPAGNAPRGRNADGYSVTRRNAEIMALIARLKIVSQTDMFPLPEQNPFPIKAFTPVTYDSK